MRRLFRREMEAIVQGRPGKDWRTRGELAHLPVPPGVPPAPDFELAR